MKFDELDDSIKLSKNILITSHINPDGDTLGAMCGLALLIELNYKKRADMLVVSEVPKIYRYLPKIKSVKHINNVDKSREYDLVINVDIASLERFCDGVILFERAKKTVNIDHHKTNYGYADLNFVDADATSTSEIVYEIAKNLGWKMNLDVANSLYTGILTDTGSFRHANTTSKSLQYAAELVSLGVEPAKLYSYCYESNPKSMALLQAYCVGKTTFLDDDKIAYTTVYKKDIEKFHGEDDCTEGLTEKLRGIVTTQIAFVAKEVSSNCTKVSMRSKAVDVAKICEAFGGGGHTFAAGCTIKSNVKDAINKILREIKKVQK